MSLVSKTTVQINTLLNKVDPTEAAVAALDTRLDTAEGTLVALDTRLDTAEGTLVALDTRLDNAEITFLPSIYNSTVNATTTASGQSEARATGAKILKVVNNGANTVYIALGQSNLDAESNLTTGVNNVERFLIPVGTKPAYINIANYSHYAWLGNGATVSVTLIQGV